MKYLFSIFIFGFVLFFVACENNNPPFKNISEDEKLDEYYIGKGKEIAASTFATLSGNLQKAMKEGGVPHAVQYCNLAAFPLVDSLSQIHKANIRRTSLKIRNPKDKPNQIELEQLKNYQKQVDAGEKLKPIVKEINGNQITFFAPIHVMPQCEKCHGKVGKSLLEKDYELIQQLYPEDEAIGYMSGDWRGMWSITFSK